MSPTSQAISVRPLAHPKPLFPRKAEIDRFFSSFELNQLRRYIFDPTDGQKPKLFAKLTFPSELVASRFRRLCCMRSAQHSATQSWDANLPCVTPKARFVELDSENHLLLEDEPAFPVFMHEMRSFLSERPV
ncbi:MAG TPA: hypothetical protein DDW52_23460 [Planctomycetaceae bacterium]|nr:hypothetical protein [Planctomycetaceae bacterium]